MHTHNKKHRILWAGGGRVMKMVPMSTTTTTKTKQHSSIYFIFFKLSSTDRKFRELTPTAQMDYNNGRFIYNGRERLG